MNPFHESVEETFRTQKVRVYTRDNTEYVGYLDRMDWNQRHVLLHGAERDGDHVGAAFISHAERIELAVQDYRVRELHVDEFKPSPYAVKRSDAVENLDYIRDTHEHRAIKSWPVVYINDAGVHEIIDGHKAVWVCRVAEVETQPCRVIECSEKEALQRFAFDHLPLSDDVEADDTKYSDAEVRKSLERMLEDWNRNTLTKIYPIDYNLHRLLPELKVGGE
jgi:hypothetical protein